MRIGVDARPLAVASGIGRYTREVLSRLVAMSDHDYFLYSTQPIQLTSDRVNYRVASGNHRYLGTLVAQSRFPVWARHDNLDVFWSPRHHLPTIKIPCVVTIHDMVWKKAPTTMIPFARLAESILMPRALRRSSQIIAVSNATRDDIVEFMPNVAPKVTVIPAAAFCSESATSNRSTTNHGPILFVGTFEPRKNLHRLLQAFRLLLTKFPHAPELVLAGQPGWKVNVHKIIRNLGLDKKVRVVEGPSDEQLTSLYCTARFLVLPSLYEGFGLPILEAMVHGKPVIVGNNSAMPEVAGPGGICVNPHDVNDIASAMSRLLEDRKLYETLSRNAKAHCASFSWDRTANDTLKVLETAGSIAIQD